MDGLDQNDPCPNCGSADLAYTDEEHTIAHCNVCNEEWALADALKRYGIDPDGSGRIED